MDKVRRWSNKCWEALSNNSDSWCFGGPVVLWESVADPPACKSHVWRWITWTNVISSASVLLESASVTGECEDVVDIPAVTCGFTARSVLTQYWIYSPPPDTVPLFYDFWIYWRCGWPISHLTPDPSWSTDWFLHSGVGLGRWGSAGQDENVL